LPYNARDRAWAAEEITLAVSDAELADDVELAGGLHTLGDDARSGRTVLKFLAAGYADPHVVKRLGRSRPRSASSIGRNTCGGCEALARFADQPMRPPELWFAEAVGTM
jgi:hypothetical protein